MDLTAALRGVIRAAVGLPDDPGQPPQIDRLALYRAQVIAASADGQTLDLRPTDSRIPSAKNVRVRVGIPGAVAVVQPGAVVLIGWDGGDPKLPYCVPSWEDGATVTKLIFKGTTVILGDESGSDFIALAQKVLTELNNIKTSFDSHTHAYNPGPSAPAQTVVPTVPMTTPSSVAAIQSKAK